MDSISKVQIVSYGMNEFKYAYEVDGDRIK